MRYRRTSTLYCAASTLAFGLLLHSAAHSQETGAKSSEVIQIPEVLVTAQKRSEKLQDVPITIDNVSGKQLEAMGVRSTEDLSVAIPGLNYTVATGYSAPYLRGIGSNNVGPGTESPVATYVDGVYIATPTAAVFALNGVSQIDVLKGPQGTLFGRNATAGVIQVTTLDPSATPGGEASFGYGNDDAYEGKIYLTGPLAPGLSINLSALDQDQEKGYGRNLNLNLETNRTTTEALRSKILWEATPATQVTLSMDYTFLRSSEGISWRPLPGALTVLGTTFTGGLQDIDSTIQPLVRDDQGGVSLKVDHDFGWARLLSITAYRQERIHQSIDGSYGLPIPLLQYQARTDTEQASQELQLVSRSSSPIKWVVGAYGFYSSGKYDPADLTGSSLSPLGEVILTSQQQARSGAVFGQATREIVADTSLTLGLRYTVEQRQVSTAEVGTLFGSDIPLGSTRGVKTFTAPTWRVSLDHKFSSDVLAYVSYDRGFKSGEFDTTAIPTVVVRPETVDSFELGVKSTAFERRLRLNLALFYSDYNNMQVPAYGTGTGSAAAFESLKNAAQAEIYGFDADARLAVTHDLTFTAGLEALHSTYKSFPNAEVGIPLPSGGNLVAPGDVTGNHTILSPAFTGFISVDWRLPTSAADLTASATYAYNSGWYADPDNRLKQPAFNQVSARLTWKIIQDRLSLSIWGRNLTNEVYAEWLSDTTRTTDVYTPSPPRTFGFTLDSKF